MCKRFIISAFRTFVKIQLQQPVLAETFSKLTSTLAHERKVPGCLDRDVEDHGHDGEGDGAAADSRGAAEGRPHHCDLG